MLDNFSQYYFFNHLFRFTSISTNIQLLVSIFIYLVLICFIIFLKYYSIYYIFILKFPNSLNVLPLLDYFSSVNIFFVFQDTVKLLQDRHSGFGKKKIDVDGNIVENNYQDFPSAKFVQGKILCWLLFWTERMCCKHVWENSPKVWEDVGLWKLSGSMWD